MLLIFFFFGLVFSLLTLRIGVLRENKASKWLSLLLFLCTMYITPYMLGYANWYSGGVTREILFFVPFMQVFLIGPVVFFYMKSLLDSGFRLSQREFLHFLPAVLYGVYSLVVFVTDKLILDEFYFYADGRDKDLANWYQASGLFSMAIYLILSLKYYTDYKKRIFNEVSYADTILFQWIRNFTIAFLGILILRVLFFIINPDWGEFGSQFWYYLSFSFIFSYVAIAGYTNVVKYTTLSEIGQSGFNKYQKVEQKEVEQDDKSQPDSSLLKETKPNQLDEARIVEWKTKLQHLMGENRLYENPRLTLTDVAQELGTTSKLISTVVNQGFRMNFNDYVNQFRVEAVQQRLKAGEHISKTLLGVALECGFNSKATFNRAFKKNTSISPKDFLESLTNE
ncbi:AraC family transcriptional regulator [Cryomorphaceae bacterium 1068]|nr:AraC family transcriptional regulator [Cryomorphaceae bacterium 1068]